MVKIIKGIAFLLFIKGILHIFEIQKLLIIMRDAMDLAFIYKIGILFLILNIIGYFIIGIFLYRFRNWARIVAKVLLSFSIVFGILNIIIMVGSSNHLLNSNLIGRFLILVVEISIICYLSKTKVKDLFKSGNVIAPE